ncbi:MerR family transcriptional regulator [Heyndrickxia ginsengihumi]|uniref:Transcriptional regulator n=1 Tax=Heyndrickxia ginsengihumi TaxID=363870 RepID=A0A0A6VEW0_9BACI|nr:MerR family transcriptional regulator [Heyndrickxia ginsengihumi]KHD85094.1 transcriptional regulator [Heyndrickxia ginsengihumi]MBE6184483.1 MerR family transcriptional regulator [Bacillus sp. (in: firmicutes)]MCM3022732.1 MerR family transcriptional regulator [Heyndrickxia ginsengihumi]
MPKTTWKIGELASQCGITVRTLHHYHQIGLLVPSEFTEAGHRLYTKADASKLQQILSLKQLGFSLEEIYNFIVNPNYDPMLVVQAQLEVINEQIKLKEKLRNKLEQLQKLILLNQHISTDQLLKIMELIRMNESNYITPELVERMRASLNNLTEEKKLKLKKMLPLVDETQKQTLQKMIIK